MTSDQASHGLIDRDGTRSQGKRRVFSPLKQTFQRSQASQSERDSCLDGIAEAEMRLSLCCYVLLAIM